VTESTDPKTVTARRRVFRAMYSFWGAVVVVIVLVLLIGGCGGSDGQAPDSTQSTTAADDGRVLVAALGDSITAGSPLWDPDPAVQDQIGPDLDSRSQFEYWASKADPALEFRNCGVFGERTDEIAQRLQKCAEGADALIIQGGINDIAQGLPVELAAEDLRGMVKAGKGIGIPVALVDVLPWNNGQPTAGKPIAELNQLIEGVGRDEGVPVFSFHDALDDPGSPGRMPADLTIDGDHPSVAGYRLLGDEVVKGLRALDLP
jgi:lysophospholipase L1-like esterase